MSLLIGTRNIADQDVAVGGVINLGNVYRKYCKKLNGIKAFDFNGTSIALQQSGIYHITATIVATSSAAGNVTIQLLENGVAIPGASGTDTFSTTTQLKTLTIDTFVLVDNNFVLGQPTIESKTISLEVLETAATINNIVVNIVKEV